MSKNKKTTAAERDINISPGNDSRHEPAISIEGSNRGETTIDIPIVPKKAKKKRGKTAMELISCANIILIGTLLMGGFVYVALLPHETVANDENRYLAKFPAFSAKAYASGEYTEGIADYFDDTVHDRSNIKQFIAENISPMKGLKYGSGGAELYGKGIETRATTSAVSSVVSTARTTTVTTAVTTVTTAPPEEDTADGELTNNILIVKKRGINLYGGAWGSEQEYASYLNAYKEALPDVRVYSMVLPTASSFYLPDKYKDLAQSEKEDFDRIDSFLVNVTPVDAYSALEKHKDEAVYSRTDHHWQPLGAYYAAKEFASAAEVPFDDLSEYTKVTLHDYVGTLYMYTQSATLLNNPEDFVYYVPQKEVHVTQYDTHFGNAVVADLLLDASDMPNSSYYMVFGADERIVHVNTECKNGRTLVIFKDSYGNALLPVLTGSFENIYLCDIRYFDLNAPEFIKNVGATDLLFTMCSFSAAGGNKYSIYNNLIR